MLLPPQGKDSSHASPVPVWDPPHGSKSSKNFSNASPSHGLLLFLKLLAWVTCMRCSLSGTNCPSVSPSQGHQHAPGWAPISTGPTEACSHGIISFFKAHPPALGQWLPAPQQTSIGCRGIACLAMVFNTSCRAISALASRALGHLGALLMFSGRTEKFSVGHQGVSRKGKAKHLKHHTKM